MVEMKDLGISRRRQLNDMNVQEANVLFLVPPSSDDKSVVCTIKVRRLERLQL
jgi:hypothetical protein